MRCLTAVFACLALVSCGTTRLGNLEREVRILKCELLERECADLKRQLAAEATTAEDWSRVRRVDRMLMGLLTTRAGLAIAGIVQSSDLNDSADEMIRIAERMIAAYSEG